MSKSSAFSDLATVVSAGFGGLSEEAAVLETPRRSSENLHASSLNTSQMHSSWPAHRPRSLFETSNPDKKKSDESMERKIKILMQNPKLWQEFKDRLAHSTHRSRSAVIQTVLKEFLEESSEIKEELAQQEAMISTQRSLQSFGPLKRLSMLAPVSSLTAGLGDECSPSLRSSFNSNSSLPAQPTANDAHICRPTITHDSSTGGSGIQLLMRASRAAASTLDSLGDFLSDEARAQPKDRAKESADFLARSHSKNLPVEDSFESLDLQESLPAKNGGSRHRTCLPSFSEDQGDVNNVQAHATSRAA